MGEKVAVMTGAVQHGQENQVALPDDEVICPACAHHFRAISQADQDRLRTLLSTSGVKGVYWNTSHRRWQARISVNGTRLNLGSFDNIEDAAKAYQRAAIENFGPFVRSEQ